MASGRTLKLAATGTAAGLFSGLLGVGGGILFVPALTLVLSLSQVRAQATSLLAIIPVALVGAWRQRRYGNVAVPDGAIVAIRFLRRYARAREKRIGIAAQ
jgi:hypothetical protein